MRNSFASEYLWELGCKGIQTITNAYAGPTTGQGVDMRNIGFSKVLGIFQTGTIGGSLAIRNFRFVTSADINLGSPVSLMDQATINVSGAGLSNRSAWLELEMMMAAIQAEIDAGRPFLGLQANLNDATGGPVSFCLFGWMPRVGGPPALAPSSIYSASTKPNLLARLT